jgi:predicted glycosyltransferase
MPILLPPSHHQLSDALRDAKLGVFKALKHSEPAEEALAARLEAELVAAEPQHLPLLLEVLARWARG